MSIEHLREEVLHANLELVAAGLVHHTFGNASAIDRSAGLVAIKPSGVPYAAMQASDIVVTDLDGKTVDGGLRPSSDLKTHLALYREFSGIGGVVHTHSTYATVWAQTGRSIPAYGTTHADYFFGPIPATEPLTDEEIGADYELNTGLAICRRFRTLDPLATPGVLVAGHAPFCWGVDADGAVHTAIALEFIAQIAFYTASLDANNPGVSPALLRRHHFRKHGPNATYGQK